MSHPFSSIGGHVLLRHTGHKVCLLVLNRVGVVTTQVLLGQLLQHTLASQFLNGLIDSLIELGLALQDGDGIVLGQAGYHECHLQLGVGMLVQIIVQRSGVKVTEIGTAGEDRLRRLVHTLDQDDLGAGFGIDLAGGGGLTGGDLGALQVIPGLQGVVIGSDNDLSGDVQVRISEVVLLLTLFGNTDGIDNGVQTAGVNAGQQGIPCGFGKLDLNTQLLRDGTGQIKSKPARSPFSA